MARRDLTKGQKAMAYAMVYPEVKRVGAARNRDRTVSRERILVAGTVLRHSPKLAEAVLD